ncbi:MAG TPA: hypothetical protein VHY83_11880 [Solirubrobacteraceae bacterium]|nr:hypothetical protein [Solirubrobacteraceae bacterium]
MKRSAEAPTARQLRYLRVLASRSASTFVVPSSRREAAREIERMRALDAEPWESRPHASGAEEEPLAYATAVHPSEVSGFGSSATWRVGTSRQTPVRAKQDKRDGGPLVRHTVSGGKHAVEVERVDGCAGLTHPFEGEDADD